MNGRIAAPFPRKTVIFSALRFCNKKEKNCNGTKCQILFFLSAYVFHFENACLDWIYFPFLWRLVKKRWTETTKILRNMKIMLDLRLFFAKNPAPVPTYSCRKTVFQRTGVPKQLTLLIKKVRLRRFFRQNLHRALLCTAAKTRLCAYLFPPLLTLIGYGLHEAQFSGRVPFAHPLRHCIQGILSVSSFLNPTLLYSINRKGLPPFASSFRMFFSRLKTGVPKRPSERRRIFAAFKQPASLWEAGRRFHFSLGRRAKPVSGKAMATTGRK